jgi:hypothetical protein
MAITLCITNRYYNKTIDTAALLCDIFMLVLDDFPMVGAYFIDRYVRQKEGQS